MKLKLLDYAAIIVSIGIIGFISYSVYAGGGEPRTVTVEASGKSYVYMLDTDRKVAVSGPLGETEIVIKDSEVFVESSPCRDKLCVKAPPLKKAGDWNACLPNKVFIRISGSKPDEPDSLSY